MPKSNKMEVSISPNEVIFPNSRLYIDSESSFDPQTSQGALVVENQSGQIRLSKSNKRATWTPQKSLTPGHHTLNVGELVTQSGRRLEKPFKIPFFVTDSKAKIPASYRVENIIRLKAKKLSFERFSADRRPRGTFIEIMKACHRKTGKPRSFAFNQSGNLVKFEKVFHKVMKDRLRKFGKIEESLHTELQRKNPNSLVDIAIWLRTTDPPQDQLKKRQTRSSKLPREVQRHRTQLSNLVGQFSRGLVKEFQPKKVEGSPLAPVIYAQLTKKQIQEVVKKREVVAVFRHETDGIDDLGNSMAIANSDDVQGLGLKGNGVKVAVWERGPDNTSNLTISAFYDPSQSKKSDHARHTHGIIKNKEKNKPKGHAPSCTLYSANDTSLKALTWAVKEKSCTVISQSFHRNSEPKSSGLSYDDIYKDWLALHWPYPTILQAAGNFWDGDPDNISPPNSEYVNHKGYNSLAVGNHNDNADAMSGSSVFRNPSTTHGDRELPEISANGTFVKTVGLTKSGTSMAAPAAAGCAALIQNANGTLKSWPEGCRAILLAGAKRNVKASTWWKDVVAKVDASDGTGAVDALESVRIAQSKKSKNASGSQRGWDVGALTSSNFGTNNDSTFAYKVKIPIGWWAPRHVKVALAWTSKVSTLNLPFINEIPLSSILKVDLDLRVYDSSGNLAGYSGSFDNSYEIAEFAGIPGETYTIRIRRWSGTDKTYYGIAWTVTGGLLLGNLLGNRTTALEKIQPFVRFHKRKGN